MKNEEINTFNNGLVMDLHPLTTPSNVLTNCLNGTLITYDGNEFVLQNDSGNGKINTAKLKPGYIPVGIKEYGGIIYVAAHNPITNKSQIGSFPSPQQLYTGEDLNIISVNFNFNSFIKLKNEVPFITSEYFKQKLFQKEGNINEIKIFHPGDKFVIISSPLDFELRQAIENGVINLRLGVINSSGNIDYIDDSLLKTYSYGNYSKKLWIYETSNSSIEDILENPDLVQVFSAKSSGSLILVIELKTIDIFNLIKQYSYNEDTDSITVRFIGEMSKSQNNQNFAYIGNTESNSDILGLYRTDNLSNEVYPYIELSGSTGSVSCTIAPVCPYGVLQRLEKSIVLDFDNIRKNEQKITEWRFYITDSYIKIGWGFDYYDINSTSSISNIEFTFLDLSSFSENIADIEGISINISKDYYSGNFEEIINFDSYGIKKNWIYIVRISKVVNGNKSVIDYKLIYTSSYFNQYYPKEPNFDSGNIIKNESNREKILLNINNSIKLSENLIESNTYYKVHDSSDFILSTGNLNPNSYIKELSSPSVNTTDYRYNTKISNTYSITATPSVQVDFDKTLYSGNYSEDLITNFFGESPDIDITGDTPDVKFAGNDTVLKSELSSPEFSVSNISWNKNTVDFNTIISRNIIARAGNSVSKNIDAERLEPIYSSNLNNEALSDLYNFNKDGDKLWCVTGDYEYIIWEGYFLANSDVTNGDTGKIWTSKLSNSDYNDLNEALKRRANDKGTVGIWSGHDGSVGSLWIPKDVTTRRSSELDWRLSSSEEARRMPESGDKWVSAVWKDTEGNYKLINLFSARNSSQNSASSDKILRLEYMLNCFLSQILVAKRTIKSLYIVGPDNVNFVYHTKFTTSINIDIKTPNPGEYDVDTYLGGDSKSIEERMQEWKSAISKEGFNLINYLPLFKISKPTHLVSTISLGDDIDISSRSDILNIYNSAYSYYSSYTATLDKDIKEKIYIGKPIYPVTANSDGSINLQQENGEYIISESQDTMVDWIGREFSLGYNINDRFINKYALKKLEGTIPEGYYNEVYITNFSTEYLSWGKNLDTSNRFPIAINVGFGTGENGKSLYTY